MKKIILMMVLILSICFLFGCKSQEEKAKEKAELDKQQMETLYDKWEEGWKAEEKAPHGPLCQTV